MIRKYVALLLSSCLVISSIPSTVGAEPASQMIDEEAFLETEEESFSETEQELQTEEESSTETEQELQIEEAPVTTDELPDNDELFAGYVDQQFYGSSEISLFSSSFCGDQLTGQTRALYDLLVERIKKIASGEEYFTQFILDAADVMEKTVFTPEELGVESFTTDNAKELASQQMTYDTKLLLNALAADMPYELFWFDKNSGGMKTSFTLGFTSKKLTIRQFKISFTVAMDYRGDSSLTVDSEKLQSVGLAVDHAKALVEDASDRSDIEKILYYKDSICSLTDYNYEAASSSYTGGYGDPWQMVYVFDGDPETKVVCEGYSKAFQYLMEESSFSSDKIFSYLVTGTMSGGKHMWNILHMDNGGNYLVDITNNKSTAANPTLRRCMEIPSRGNASEGYYFEARQVTGNGTSMFVPSTTYIYDQETRMIYSEEDLTLSDCLYEGVRSFYFDPVITSQPQSVKVKPKDKVVFQISARDAESYQWQYSKDGVNWRNSSATGAATSEMTYTAYVSNAGTVYRCRITGINGSVIYSDTVGFQLPEAAEIIVQPKSVTAKAGEQTMFSVYAENAESYQWQYSKDNGNTWYRSGATGSTTACISFVTTASKNGYQYRCVITDAYGDKIISSPATLTVFAITKQPVSQTVSAGKYALFTLEAMGDSLTYQWQYSKDNGKTWITSSAITAKTPSLKILGKKERNGWKYRCIVTDAEGRRITSSTAKLTVN